MAGIYFQSRLATHGNRYATMTGKGFRPRRIDLGRWRYLTAAIFIVYFLLMVASPFFVLLWSSFQKFYTAPSFAAMANLTLDPYRFVFSHPTLVRSFWNSLLLCLGTATIIMLVTAVIAWMVVKTKIPGRWLLDNLASMPMVFPGLVLGLAIMIFYLNVNIGVYGTMWIMLIAYVTRFMPYGMRYNMTSMIQIHHELEESAAMSGASWGKTFVRIILPLLKPGLLAGWIYIAIVSVRELSSSILLYSPGTEVVSIVIWDSGRTASTSSFQLSACCSSSSCSCWCRSRNGWGAVRHQGRVMPEKRSDEACQVKRSSKASRTKRGCRRRLYYRDREFI